MLGHSLPLPRKRWVLLGLPTLFLPATRAQVVACMNPTAGSFLVNPRLQRWFATFAIGLPGPTSLLTIYQVRKVGIR